MKKTEQYYHKNKEKKKKYYREIKTEKEHMEENH